MLESPKEWPELIGNREEYEDYKVPWEGRGRIHIPMVARLIERAAFAVRGTQMNQKQIRQELGRSQGWFTNHIADDHCGYSFISEICGMLDLPVYLFAQVSELSSDYERKYERDPTAALTDFENQLRQFLDKSASFQPYQSVFDTPDYYQPPHSVEVGIKVSTFRCGKWTEMQRLDWSNPAERKANVTGVKPVKPDFQFHDGELFRFDISSGKVGRNVIILETDMTPHRQYSWALINGRPPGKPTLIGPVKPETGVYDSCNGEWSGSSGMCRIAVALVDPSIDADKWRNLEAGAICPHYMLNALAEAVKSDLCWLGTFTYEMTPRIQIS